MMASRVVGYLLLAILVGSVLVSIILLMVQWIRSEDNRTKAMPVPTSKTSTVLYYPALTNVSVVYHTAPSSLTEV